MEKNLGVAITLAMLLFFPACANLDLREQTYLITSDPSIEEMFDGDHWVTKPSNSVITIVGIAGRRPNRNAAIQDALLDAARKAALYDGVYAESAAVLYQGQGYLDYYSDFDYQIALENNHEGYVEVLIFDKDNDVLEKNDVVIVRAKYHGVSDVPPYKTAVTDGVPEWVTNFSADIPGFLVGVGFSKNKGSRPKTYAASYEDAIVRILPQLSANITGEVIDVSGGKSTSSVTKSEGSLVNVMILETWYDKKTSSVWTLIAAKEKQ
jgi:hypothetical protein